MIRQVPAVVMCVAMTIVCTCSPAPKKTARNGSDPCMEAIRLRKQAERTTTEERGILEAKAAAMQDICDERRQENGEKFDEYQRRRRRHKKKK